MSARIRSTGIDRSACIYLSRLVNDKIESFSRMEAAMESSFLWTQLHKNKSYTRTQLHKNYTWTQLHKNKSYTRTQLRKNYTWTQLHKSCVNTATQELCEHSYTSTAQEFGAGRTV